MIYFYKGAKGRGKTLTMTKDAYLFHCDKKPILSNMQSIKFAKHITNDEILAITKESPLRNCVILVDEIQTLFNARRSQKKENLNFSFFLQQIRKRNIDLLATTQYSNTVDLIFRQHVDYIVIPRFDKELKVCHVRYIDLNSIEDDEHGQMGVPDEISTVFDCEEIFGMYDTTEIVS